MKKVEENFIFSLIHSTFGIQRLEDRSGHRIAKRFKILTFLYFILQFTACSLPLTNYSLKILI